MVWADFIPLAMASQFKETLLTAQTPYVICVTFPFGEITVVGSDGVFLVWLWLMFMVLWVSIGLMKFYLANCLDFFYYYYAK